MAAMRVWFDMTRFVSNPRQFGQRINFWHFFRQSFGNHRLVFRQNFIGDVKKYLPAGHQLEAIPRGTVPADAGHDHIAVIDRPDHRRALLRCAF